MSNADDPEKSGKNAEKRNIWGAAVRFIRDNPEYGIVPLLLISVPLLSKYVPDDSKIGPIAYVSLVIIVLPVLHRLMQYLTNHILSGAIKITVGRFIRWCVGAVAALMVVAMLPLLGVLPMANANGSNPLNDIASLIWDVVAPGQVAPGQPCEGPGCLQRIQVPASNPTNNLAENTPNINPNPEEIAPRENMTSENTSSENTSSGNTPNENAPSERRRSVAINSSDLAPVAGATADNEISNEALIDFAERVNSTPDSNTEGNLETDSGADSENSRPDSYGECVIRAYRERNSAGIVACADLLEG